MEKVKIGEYKIGDDLIIDFGEDNPNNKEVQVRAIVDMEVVILQDKNQNYLMETVKYMNVNLNGTDTTIRVKEIKYQLK